MIQVRRSPNTMASMHRAAEAAGFALAGYPEEAVVRLKLQTHYVLAGCCAVFVVAGGAFLATQWFA
ncbi:hypothetical protein PY365_08205 [Roseiarcaceae bacterium H3SJ34-1]|uniref:hypothetical protein n=1 Tax=Terripilifer ovatus TaxID=3032367 RepID=UPI003AB962D8|nr:hypothetical protein [Roseiarcaceae bacterium H3SJ34-1]